MSQSNTSRSGDQKGSDRIRVLLVDDHPAIREAVADTINGTMDMEVCGEASSSDGAFRLVEKLEPDVAIVDVSLEDAHGLDLVQNIRSQYPDVKMIVFSMYDENVYAERAIRAGASGYLMKSEPTKRLIEAIRSISRGEVYLSRRMASRILNKVAMGRTSEPNFAIDELTDRAKEKLGFDTVSELLQYAVQWTYGQGTHGRDSEHPSPKPPAEKEESDE